MARKTQSDLEPIPKIVWGNIVFFAVTGLVAVIGGPLYIWRFGFPVFELAFTLFYGVLTGISITAGYHRLFSHASYRAHPFIRFLLLFFGAGAFQHSALRWAGQHRDHHNFTAKSGDPYSISKGFFYAHIGWMMFWEHPAHDDNVRDLKTSRLIMHQHRYYIYWAVTSGILLPLAIGLMRGNLLAAFIFPVCLRIAFVHHATWCVNSVCHWFGSEPYDLHSTARNNTLVAFITNGEGYHNYHHRFPGDFRNGIHWYEWDPTKWLIELLARTGLTWNLKETTEFKIIEAKLTTRHEQLHRKKQTERTLSHLERFFNDIEKVHRTLRKRLFKWEKMSKEYDALFTSGDISASDPELRLAHQRMDFSKQRFERTYRRRHRYRKPSKHSR